MIVLTSSKIITTMHLLQGEVGAFLEALISSLSISATHLEIPFQCPGPKPNSTTVSSNDMDILRFKYS